MSKVNFVAPRSVDHGNNNGVQISARDLGLALGIPDKYEEPYSPLVGFGKPIPTSMKLVRRSNN